MNWSLLVLTRAYTEETSTGVIEHKVGDSCVMKTSMAPSISEYPQENPFGVFLITPGAYIERQAIARNISPVALSPDQVKELVLEYWNAV